MQTHDFSAGTPAAQDAPDSTQETYQEPSPVAVGVRNALVIVAAATAVYWLVVWAILG